MPLLTLQSAKSYGFGRLLAEDVINSFESIASTKLSSSTSTVTFTSIPSTFKHLQVRGILRGNASANQQTAAWRLNGAASTGNYRSHCIISKSNTPVSYETGPTDQTEFYEIPAANQSSNIFGSFIMDILDYTSTNKYKVVKTTYGFDNNNANNSNTISIFSGVWLNTNAVTSIDLINQTSPNQWVAGSEISLYGIKG